MTPKRSARVRLNRGNLNALGLAVANGMESFVRRVVTDADPPDATPYGEGLVTQGGWLVYHRSKKVGGGSLQGKQPRKPRGFRVRGNESIEAIAGFGFPGRFQEMGTIHHAAQPFLWPSFTRNLSTLDDDLRQAVRAAKAGRAIRQYEP
jgi:hypothetical protein